MADESDERTGWAEERARLMAGPKRKERWAAKSERTERRRERQRTDGKGMRDEQVSMEQVSMEEVSMEVCSDSDLGRRGGRTNRLCDSWHIHTEHT